MAGAMTMRSATVRYSYKAAHEDELDLEVDDIIDVLEEAETGWMKGKLRNTGRIGLFPTNFVHFLGKLIFDVTIYIIGCRMSFSKEVKLNFSLICCQVNDALSVFQKLEPI